MFVDRQSTYPNRYKITTESGETYYAVLERADVPLVAGTPINAETLNGLRRILEADQYGTEFPANPSVGQFYLLKL